jgi:hypothetical protein
MLVAHYTDAQLGAIEHVVNIGLLRKRKMIPRESFWAPLKKPKYTIVTEISCEQQ